MNLNGTTNGQPRTTLPAPLRTAADMPSRCDNVELDFDTAAQRIIEAHNQDCDAEDLPIADLKTWAVVPYEGQFALAPLTPRTEAAACGGVLEPDDPNRGAGGLHPTAARALAARHDELPAERP